MADRFLPQRHRRLRLHRRGGQHRAAPRARRPLGPAARDVPRAAARGGRSGGRRRRRQRGGRRVPGLPRRADRRLRDWSRPRSRSSRTPGPPTRRCACGPACTPVTPSRSTAVRRARRARGGARRGGRPRRAGGAQRAGRAAPGGGAARRCRSCATAGASGSATSPCPSGCTTSRPPGLPPVERGLRAVPADGGNLPVAAGPLHGRDDVLAALAEPRPLTTLVGPPGRRQDRHGAGRRAGGLPRGRRVWLVPLETLPAVRSVASAMLSTLGLPGGGERRRRRRAAERTRACCCCSTAPTTASRRWRELAAACRGGRRDVRVLVTARTPLRLEGERVVRMRPARRCRGRTPTPEDVLAAPSVRLLLSGAAQRWDDPRHAEALAGLARRGDGLPLALELVGARLAALSPTDLLGRVDAQLARAGRTGALRDGARQHLVLRSPTRPSALGAPVGVRGPGRPRRRRAGVRRRRGAARRTRSSTRSPPWSPAASSCSSSTRTAARRTACCAACGSTAPSSSRQRRTDRRSARPARGLGGRRGRALAAPGRRRAAAGPAAGAGIGAGRRPGRARRTSGPRDPERVLALLLPLRRHLRESLDLADLLALAERLPAAPRLRGRRRRCCARQLSWERAPGPETLRAVHARPRTPPGTRRRRSAWTCSSQLVLAREQFGLDPDPAREAALERAAAESGDPGLLVRATALRAHGAVARRRGCCSTAAVELARTQAPGLLLWATGRRLQLWGGQRPRAGRGRHRGQLLLGAPPGRREREHRGPAHGRVRPPDARPARAGRPARRPGRRPRRPGGATSSSAFHAAVPERRAPPVRSGSPTRRGCSASSRRTRSAASVAAQRRHGRVRPRLGARRQRPGRRACAGRANAPSRRPDRGDGAATPSPPPCRTRSGSRGRDCSGTSGPTPA